MTKKVKKVIREAAEVAAVAFAVKGWSWAISEPHTPTIRDIETQFTRLYLDLDRPGAMRSTGRLVVRRTELGVEFSFDLGYA